MTKARSRRINRGILTLLALATAVIATGCATKANGATAPLTVSTQTISRDTRVYPDAAREISPRWWLARRVDEAPKSDDPAERAATEVLQTFFGSDSADAMLSVSTGAARVFAEFMSVMEAVSGQHPMEEVILQQVPRVADGQRTSEVLFEAEITEDRSTGSGQANRTTFDQFVMELNSNLQFQLVDFQRNGTWISNLVVPGDSVEPVGTDSGAVRIVAVVRSSLGRYMIAGEITRAGVDRWALRDARLVPNDRSRDIETSFSEVGPPGPEDVAPFLITFDDHGLSEQGVRLILPSLSVASQPTLVFQVPPLGKTGSDLRG